MMGKLDQAKAAIANRVEAPEVAMVLGSGLGRYADTLEDARTIPYSQIPHMPLAGVSGHAGNLVVGRRGGKRVAAMQGRTHLYEGHGANDVTFGVRLLAWLGAKTLIVTNAAGGIDSRLRVGDLMAISDQMNLTGTSSLLGPNDEQLGPRFLDMTVAFDPRLIELATSVAADQGFELRRGVYAGLLGPAYETPAEIRMLRTLGADAVGMSTVLEVLAARHMGMRVLGISCISNLAAGVGEGPLSHADVEKTAARVRPRFESLLSGVLGAI
ncbi:MAG: purine-nucleoside phosphorylase [Myxococcales bacterium]|jgi:purine-nucleoside phosphorylase|nr:purine-nucleoside phosphorylase [Myxococcales bacterium]MDH3843103.1 purine-nucleoside phosphorylase [Myxococcales bacterium]